MRHFNAVVLSLVMTRALPLALALALGALACHKDGAEPAPKASPPAEPDDGLFTYARLIESRGAPPRRFAAPLPVGRTELEAWRGGDELFPPEQLVEDLLCVGDADMRRRLADALDRAGDPALADDYGRLFRHCSSPELCAWAAADVAGARGLRRAVLLTALAACEGPAIDSLFAGDDVPALAVVTRARQQDRPPFTPRLAAAARELIVQGERWSDVFEPAGALIDTGDPRAADALVAVHGELTDQDKRLEIAMRLFEFPAHAGARRLYRAACAQEPDDPRCKPEPAEAPPEPPPTIDQLAACAGGDDDYRAARCLRELAAADRPRAVARARQQLSAGRADQRTELARTLDRFPDAGALPARLAQLGLLGPRPLRDPNAITAGELLTESGRVAWFDVETGQWPNQHDSLVRRELAPLVAPDLAGVTFEELAIPRGGDQAGAYGIVGHVGGKRYGVVARDLGDWYDLEAVLGFMNSLLRARGSGQRCLTLPTGDQTARVLCGPASGLRAALADGLIATGAAGDAEQAGKAFEEQVVEQLKREGKVVERNVRVPNP